MRARGGRICACVALLLPITACASTDDDQTLTVFAAASLRDSFTAIGERFEQAHPGVRVTFSFGATADLAKQIENGAPADLFFAANVSFVEGLEKRGLIIPDTKALYAQGRLTLWTRGGLLVGLERVEDLARPEFKRVAIANPEHAPYGAAAREALQTAGVWEAVSRKLVYGENISQTLQYAESGNVDAAVVALSLSKQSRGRWVLVPAELHRPLNQALAVVRGTKHEPEARRFAAFVNSAEGRAVMRKYGFVLPGEEPLK